MREGLDDTKAKFLALLAFVDGDILNVTNTAETTEELALDEDGTYSNDLVTRLVENDNGEVCTRDCAHGVELVDPCYLAEIVDDGENGKDIEMSTFVVC
jgi:hypothetical protein